MNRVVDAADVAVRSCVPPHAQRSVRLLDVVAAAIVALLGTPAVLAQGSAQGDTSRVVVLPDSTMPHILTQCSRDTPTGISGFWRPRDADVLAAEDAVDRALIEAIDSVIARDTIVFAEMRKRPRATWPHEYYRQYAGIRRRDGRRTIYINGFASGWPSELSERVSQSDGTGLNPLAQPDWWRFSAASVCDGGALYFGAEYDPSTGRVVAFQFNERE